MTTALIVLLIYAALAGTCIAKGKPWFALLGLFIGWFAIVGACRLAKPGSWFYRSSYTAAKQAASDARFAPGVRS